jgi:DNA invertase Pin-like site-specific DNA recombinase
VGKILGYGRVSQRQGQDVTSQKVALEKHGAVVVFTDTGNGSTLDGRVQLESVLRLLDRGDTLLALHPDRIARDTADLLTVAKQVVEKGAVLKIIDPGITFNGTDIMAEAMLTLFGMIGRIEKHFLKARQLRAIEVAKAKGVYKGRKPSIDPEQVKALNETEKLGASQIAKRLKIGRASVYRLLQAQGGSVMKKVSL